MYILCNQPAFYKLKTSRTVIKEFDPMQVKFKEKKKLEKF